MASVEAERDPRMSRVVTGHDRSEGVAVEEQRLGGGPVRAAECAFGGGARFQQHRVPYAFGFGGSRDEFRGGRAGWSGVRTRSLEADGHSAEDSERQQGRQSGLTNGADPSA